MTSIGEEAFYGCDNLVSFEASENNENYVSVDGVLYDKKMETLICYPSCKSDTCFDIPETVTHVKAYAFSGVIAIEKVTLAGDIKFADVSFLRCDNLMEISGLDKQKNRHLMRHVQGCFKEEIAEILITGKADERRDWSGFEDWSGYNNTINENLRDAIALECVNYLKNHKYTKTHLKNLAEYFNHNIEHISAKAFALFYEILISKKADKALELIPINSIARKKEQVSDHDAELLKKFLSEEDSQLQSFEISKGVLVKYFEAEGVTEVVIPDSVKEIGSYAFDECPNIVSVKIPKNVTEISDSTFDKCTSLKEITVDEENENYSSSNGMLLRTYTSWRDDKKHTEIVICPKGITDGVIPAKVTEFSIGKIIHLKNVAVEKSSKYFTAENNVIYSKNKTKLICSLKFNESVVIPDTVKVICDRAFYECQNLESVEIPDSVTEIGESAFARCNRLTEITIPDSVKSMGAGYSFNAPFQGCENLKTVTLPKEMEYLGAVFSECKNLESLELPKGIKTIECCSFEDCEGLKKIVIPDGVEKIGEYAFNGCKSLCEIRIPDSVTDIHSNNFYGCKSLPEENGIYYADKWAVRSVDSVAGQSYSLREGTVGILHGIFGTHDVYFNAKKKFGSVYIPESVKHLTPSTLRIFEEIKVAENNESFISVDGVLFDKDMKTLLMYPMEKRADSYVIPDGVTTISAGAFEYCKNLKKVIIPEGVTTIGGSAFSYTSNLTEIELPYTAKKIGDYAFVNCLYSRAGKSHDHSITLYLCKDEIKIPLILQGNWNMNAEEKRLNNFISATSVDNMEYNFNDLKSSSYKTPLALFTVLTNHDAEFAHEYLRKNIKRIFKELIDTENIPVIYQILPLGYVNEKNIDDLFNYANTNEKTEIKLILMNYKHEHIGQTKKPKLKL